MFPSQFRSGRIVVAALLTAICCVAQADHSQVADSKLCYAFLQDGTLRTVCNGKSERIPTKSRLTESAISQDGSYAAFESQLKVNEDKYVVSIVFLAARSPAKAMTTGRLYLRSTCGELVGIDTGSLDRHNLLTWQPDRFPPYKFFRCSSDKQVVAGWTEADDEKRKSAVDVYTRPKSPSILAARHKMPNF
jgi:hypothetical protein